MLPLKEVRPEIRRMGEVPQIFADELGWESLVAEVAKVYESLPPAERSRAMIWGAAYGEAGAIDRRVLAEGQVLDLRPARLHATAARPGALG